MKKILTIALVAVLAATSVFAGVSFSGAIQSGYALVWDKDGNFVANQYGQDGEKTEAAKLNLKVADDNGLWNATIQGALKTDSSGAVDASVTLDAAKLIASAFDAESPVSIKLSLVGGDRITALRAYSNKSSNNLDRVRTATGGWKTNLVVAYENLVQVQFGISPKITGVKAQGSTAATTSNAIVTSALIAPVKGVKVSVGYGLNAEKRLENTIFGAANVDIAKLADLDFTIGVSASDAFEFKDDNKKNTLAAEVYGAFEGVSLNAEYSLATTDNAGTKTNKHGLHIGADFSDLVANSTIDAYVGSGDVSDFNNNWYIGADLGYKIAGVGLNLGLEYNVGGSYNYDSTGFLVVPSISVAF